MQVYGKYGMSYFRIIDVEKVTCVGQQHFGKVDILIWIQSSRGKDQPTLSFFSIILPQTLISRQFRSGPTCKLVLASEPSFDRLAGF